MNKNDAVFAMLLACPSMLVFLLGYIHSMPVLDNLSAAFALIAITLCPFLGAVFFEWNESLILSLLIPVALTLAKAAHFDGAERLVVVGFMVFLGASFASCSIGWLIKYLYAKYSLKAI